MTYQHYEIHFANGTQTGAYAADPRDALDQVYLEDLNGDQPDVIGVFLTGNDKVGAL